MVERILYILNLNLNFILYLYCTRTRPGPRSVFYTRYINCVLKAPLPSPLPSLPPQPEPAPHPQNRQRAAGHKALQTPWTRLHHADTLHPVRPHTTAPSPRAPSQPTVASCPKTYTEWISSKPQECRGSTCARTSIALCTWRHRHPSQAARPLPRLCRPGRGGPRRHRTPCRTRRGQVRSPHLAQ